MTTDHIASYACYRRGCRRDECRTADRNYRKRYELQRLRGIPAVIPGPTVAAHLRTVISSGRTVRGIAKETGVSARAIGYILHGQATVTRARALALLAVQPLEEAPRVDPTGTIRRIQALASIGWPVVWTAEQAGHTPCYLFNIIAGRVPAVPTGTAQRIAAIYRKHSTRPGPSEFARTIARRNNWDGPLAWDGNIDDPEAKPEKAEPYKPAAKYKRDPDRTREIEHLYLLGESLPSIAKQLGSNEKYIGDQLAAVIAKRAARARQPQQRDQIGEAA